MTNEGGVREIEAESEEPWKADTLARALKGRHAGSNGAE